MLKLTKTGGKEMKNATRIIALVLVVLIMATLLYGCDNGNPLIGKWRGDWISFEFFPDGYLTMGRSSGTYSIDGNRVQIHILNQVDGYEFNVSGNVLTLEGAHGNTLRLTRVH
jgi:hypothetical protein